MGDRTTKRLNLIDAVVLVAATATGLALGRAVASWRVTPIEPINVVVADYAVSMALMWTLAILSLNLTRHLTTRRELACRPGFSAAVAIVVVRASDVIYYAIVKTIRPPYISSPGSQPDWLWYLLSMNVNNVVRDGSTAGVVTAVWLMTAMAGCWRAEKSWIDRTGRALGVFWLLVAVLYWLSLWVFPAPDPPSLF
jgi:hypothetical protein